MLLKEYRAGHHRDRQLQGPGLLRNRPGCVPPLPPQPGRPAERVSGDVPVDWGVRQRGTVDGSGVRGRRRHRQAVQRTGRPAGAAVPQVLKLRGSGFLSGRHAYRLSEAGRRCSYAWPTSSMPRPTRWPLSGSRPIPALDEMLGDGYWPGAATLVAGPTGSGKPSWACTSSSAASAVANPAWSPPCRRNPTQLQRIAQGFAGQL